MKITQKILDIEAGLSGKLEGYIKDDNNIMYLGGLLVGSTAIAGLTKICERKYLEGFGTLATSCLTPKYVMYTKKDITEKDGTKCHQPDLVKKR